jgi:hypothetical protein
MCYGYASSCSWGSKLRSPNTAARELTDEEHLPYPLAIHVARDESGHAHNPHAHLIFVVRGMSRSISRLSEGSWSRRSDVKR